MEVRAGRVRGGREPGEVLAGVEQAGRRRRRARRGRRRCRSPRGAAPAARTSTRPRSPRASRPASTRSSTWLAPQARSSEPHSRHSHVDRLVGDQPLDERVGVERVAEQGLAGLVAVALDERPRSPLVAGMDDAAVAGRAAEAERLGLDERDAGAAPGQLAGRGDPGVAAADDDDVRRVGQRPAPPIREVRHRRVPVGPPLVVVVERRGTHRRSVAERRVRHAPWNASQSRRPRSLLASRRRGLRAGPDAVAIAVRGRRRRVPADVGRASGTRPRHRARAVPALTWVGDPITRRRGRSSIATSTSTTPSSRSTGMPWSPAGVGLLPADPPGVAGDGAMPGQPDLDQRRAIRVRRPAPSSSSRPSRRSRSSIRRETYAQMALPPQPGRVIDDGPLRRPPRFRPDEVRASAVDIAAERSGRTRRHVARAGRRAGVSPLRPRRRGGRRRSSAARARAARARGAASSCRATRARRARPSSRRRSIEDDEVRRRALDEPDRATDRRGAEHPRRPDGQRLDRPLRAAAAPRRPPRATTPSAVSMPLIPFAASPNSTSLSTSVCGAWSVAIASAVPSSSASRHAAASAGDRSGGLTRSDGRVRRRDDRAAPSAHGSPLASHAQRRAPASHSSVSARWCGVTSQVTGRPAAFARRTRSSAPAVERCVRWRRAPRARRGRRRRGSRGRGRRPPPRPRRASPAARARSRRSRRSPRRRRSATRPRGGRRPAARAPRRRRARSGAARADATGDAVVARTRRPRRPPARRAPPASPRRARRDTRRTRAPGPASPDAPAAARTRARTAGSSSAGVVFGISADAS